MIDRTEMKYLISFHGVWLLLLLEYLVFRWDLSLTFAIGWGILTLLHTIPVLLRCAIKIVTK